MLIHEMSRDNPETNLNYANDLHRDENVRRQRVLAMSNGFPNQGCKVQEAGLYVCMHMKVWLKVRIRYVLGYFTDGPKDASERERYKPAQCRYIRVQNQVCK